MMEPENHLKYSVAAPPTPTSFSLMSPRGAKLATRLWPASSPTALCLLVHGGGWHSGYFEELAMFLSQRGTIFCGSYDQVSCGYSDVEPGTPAPGVTHIHNFDCFVEDLFEAIEWLKREAGRNNLPLILLGESFGGLQVIAAAFQAQEYKVKIDGIICLGGMLEISPKFLPPALVVEVLVFLAKYYPRLVMPATDFESTFDDAFGDKEWARTTRQDPKIATSIHPTIGAVAATLATGDELRPRAKEFPVPFLAIHGRRDTRTSSEAMVEFVDQMGPSKGSLELMETEGHQLLQDVPEISMAVMNKVKTWIEQILITKYC